MKHFLNIFILFVTLSASGQGGYLKPSFLAWPPIPYDSTKMYSLQINPVTLRGYWAEAGSSANFYTLPPDSICVINSGDTICVANDSVTVTSGQICVTQMGVTTCVGGGAVTIYSGNGTISSTRQVETAGWPLSFTRLGVPAIKVNDTGDSISVNLSTNYTNNLYSVLGLSNSGTGNIVQRFNGQGDGEDYCFGVDKTKNAFVMSEGSTLTTSPFCEYYAGGDTFRILKNTIWRKSLAGESGLKMVSDGTAAASNLQKVIEVDLKGANSNASQSTYGSYISNTHTGTGATNIGSYATVSGSTGTGIWGNASAGGTGVKGVSATGSGVYGSSLTNNQGFYGAIAEKQVTSSSVVRPLLVSTILSTGHGDDDLGTGIDFASEPQSGTTATTTNYITSGWGDSTGDGYTSSFYIYGQYQDAMTAMFGINNGSISRAGVITFPGYNGALDDGTITDFYHRKSDGTVASSPVNRLNTNSVTSNSTQTLSAPGNYVNTSGAPTWSLPTVSASVTPNIYYIKNKSASSITLNVLGGGTTIIDDNSTTAVTSVAVTTGESITIICDGTTWNVMR